MEFNADTPPDPIAADQNSEPLNGVFTRFLQMLPGNREFVFRLFDNFPLFIEVFAPDGTSIFMNRVGMELINVKDASLIVGKYNLLDDPVCNDQMGLRDMIQKAFSGEAVVLYDVTAPVQDLVDRGVVSEKPFEKSYMDWYLNPVKHNGELVFVVFVCVVKKLFYGRADLTRVKDYMDSYCQKKFDPAVVAKALNMSERQLYKLFSKHTGMTPGDYHRKCKIERLKEKLADKSINVKEAFLACGENSRGNIAKVFKKMTGMSPSKYRNSLL